MTLNINIGQHIIFLNFSILVKNVKILIYLFVVSLAPEVESKYNGMTVLTTFILVKKQTWPKSRTPSVFQGVANRHTEFVLQVVGSNPTFFPVRIIYTYIHTCISALYQSPWVSPKKQTFNKGVMIGSSQLNVRELSGFVYYLAVSCEGRRFTTAAVDNIV